MQLKRSRAYVAWPALALALCASDSARAQSSVSAGTSVLYEPGRVINMLVLVPEVGAEAVFGEAFAVNAGWTADVVSGASVAVVDLPAESVDAISSASVTDVRHVLGGGVSLRDGQSSLNAGYRYGFEEDYLSHGFDVSARTELADRNTAFELAYARGIDRVCDSPDASEPSLKQKLDDSAGCFGSSDERAERDVALHTLQGSWTQSLTPWLATQATLSAQLLEGFQSNPYRAVRIGRTAAQEHHPSDRARYALGIGARIWIEPLSGALQPQLRVYRDTWDVRSFTGDIGYEQSLGAGVRLRARVRYYLQSAASFYSDDYVLAPRGQYFTGDRELSAMRSLLLGGQIAFTPEAGDDGTVLGFLDELTLIGKADVMRSFFPDFHYDRVAVPNDLALIGTLSLLLVF